MQGAMADDKVQNSQYGAGAPFAASGAISTGTGPAEQEDSGDDVTNARDHQGRYRFNRIPYGEISRSPDNVDGKEGSQQSEAAGFRRSRQANCGSVDQAGLDGLHRITRKRTE